MATLCNLGLNGNLAESVVKHLLYWKHGPLNNSAISIVVLPKLFQVVFFFFFFMAPIRSQQRPVMLM